MAALEHSGRQLLTLSADCFAIACRAMVEVLDEAITKYPSLASAMHCWAVNNIFIERLLRSLKQEAVYLHELQDGFQAKPIIDNWIEFYNSDRPHTALDKRTPDTAYFIQAEIRKAA